MGVESDSVDPSVLTTGDPSVSTTRTSETFDPAANASRFEISVDEEPRDPALSDSQILARAKQPTPGCTDSVYLSEPLAVVSKATPTHPATLPAPVQMWNTPKPAARQWVIPGFIPIGDPTVLFADGGKWKSYLMTALAVAVSRGEADFCGLPLAVGGNVLYLDAEMTEDDFKLRLERIGAALGLANGPVGLSYQRLTAPMTDEFTRAYVRGLIDAIRPAPVLTVLDSWQATTQIDPLNVQGIVREFMRLREWPGAVVIIDHEPAGERDEKRPFGSAYKMFCARSVIRVLGSAAVGADDVVLSLHQIKNTHGPMADAALRLRFDQPKFTGPVHFEAASGSATAGAIKKAKKIVVKD